MFDWKQRLYAFLLRRLLGPWLDEESLNQLYQSIELVSLQEGKIVLKQVGLNTEYLTQKLSRKSHNNNNNKLLSIRKARIHRLEISLALQENNSQSPQQQQEQQQQQQDDDDDDDDENPQAQRSSLAWRTLQLGTAADSSDSTTSSNSAAAVALVVDVLVDGISIEVEPHDDVNDDDDYATSPDNGAATNDSSAQAAKGMLSSYIDAALSSLRLTVKVSNLTIRTWSKTSNNDGSSEQRQQSSSDWIELKVKTISYHDVDTKSTGQSREEHSNSATTSINSVAASAALEHSQQQASSYETVMHKALDITRISITTGSSSSSNNNNHDPTDPCAQKTQPPSPPVTSTPLLVGLVEGTSSIRIRAIQYQQRPQQSASSASLSPPKLQQDVELTFSQKINFLVSQQCLLRIQRVSQSYQQQQHHHHHHHHHPPVSIHSATNDTPQHDAERNNKSRDDTTDQNEQEEVAADLKTIEGIMQQYHQARLLAERNQVRGGILLPSESGMIEGDGGVTFDAFFDANEGSFQRYSTMLMAQSTRNIDQLNEDGSEKVCDSDNDDAAMDFVHTKMKCHLVGGSAKIVLISDDDPISPATTPAATSAESAIPDWKRQRRRLDDEYILLTFSDLNLSSSQSLRSSTYSLSVTHLEIEDSLLQPSCLQETGMPQAEIGSLLCFVTPSSSSHDENDENELLNDSSGDGEDMLLCQAPVISMDVTATRSKSSSSDGKVQLDLSLEPMQFTYRQAVASKLTRMLSEVAAVKRKSDKCHYDDDEYSEMEDYMENECAGLAKIPIHYPEQAPKPETVTASLPPPKKSNLCARVSCPSVDVLLPVSSTDSSHDWSALFKRCGYNGSSAATTTRPCLGLHFDNPLIEMGTAAANKKRQDLIDPALVVSCQHVLVFALSPPLLSSARRLPRQFDILALCGRATVDPVSIRVYRDLVYEQEQSEEKDSLDNVATRAFPMTPPISSFKARQEDDDDDEDGQETMVDPSSSSIGGGDGDSIPVATRQEMRGSDPQPRMVEETASSNCVVEIRVPDVSCDVSAEELATIQAMIHDIQSSRASKNSSSEPEEEMIEPPATASPAERTSISFTCDSIALAIRGPSTANTLEWDEQQMFAYIVRADTLQAHTLLESGKGFRHIRFLVHELDFFEMQDQSSTQQQGRLITAEDRSNALSQRIRQSSYSGIVTPIFYRSHLFSPISRQSPCVLFDILDTSKTIAGTADSFFVERKVYATLYDVTYRYDYDSQWISILQSIFKTPENDTQKEAVETKSPDKNDSLTRVFFSITDCNFDYTACRRFRTPSRIIARIGDLRITSNILSPAPSVQAFKLSLGDFSLYLCNSRYPYNFENSRLLDADVLLKPEQVEHSQRDSASCLRAMNYRTVVLLDAADGVVAIAKGKPKKHTDPRVKTILTLGEVGLFACKDSFHLFLKSIGELSVEATALNDRALSDLKQEPPFVPPLTEPEAQQTIANRNEQKALHPVATRTALSIQRKHDFLLDGYDWTTVSQGGSTPLGIPPGEEQSSRWYKENEMLTIGPPVDKTDVLSSGCGLSESKDEKEGVHFISQHFPAHPANDPLVDGDMGAAKYSGTGSSPQVQSRVVVQNMRIKLRFFDGYDWPEALDPKLRNLDRHRSFIIEQPNHPEPEADMDIGHDEKKQGESDRKADLMANLLDGPSEKNDTFQDAPLPEERGARLKEKADLRRLARRTDKYLQISASGITVRTDSLAKADDHILASCLYIKAQDLFLAETISGNKPIKMVGEWFNEVEHPRDTNSGLFFMKMVTWHAAKRITDDDEVANDECEATVKLLPLRCFLDQRAIRFTSSFFRSSSSGDEKEAEPGLPPGLHSIPPPLFRTFRIKPFKLKVDYKPEKLDAQALRNGQIVELINISPLDGMVLTLQQVEATNKVGFGAVMGEAIGCWIRDICSTQLLKFLASSRPLEPITNIGGGFSDLIVLPWEAFQHGESVKKAMRSGARSFARSLAYETFTISSGLTEFVATTAAAATGSDSFHASSSGSSGMGPGGGSSSGMPPRGGTTNSNVHHSNGMLPMRPLETPRGVSDIGPHALESLSRGLATANLKIVVIPYREYRRSGTTGAVRSVLKGIPVAIAAPASGAAEAISFTLLGMRNSLRPDIYKEEEVSLRGLRLDGS